MTGNGNGNGNHNGNGNGTSRWWQIWKRGELDLSPYRRLAHQLHNGLPRAAGSSRSILVVTPNESNLCVEGAVQLSSCMAEELHRPVLLMDGTEDSGVSRTLGGSTSQGLTDFLADPVKPLHELALQTSQQNVWFLPKGKGSSFPASPEHAEDLLAAAAKHWDFIVVAGGAVLKNSLALGMARHVGRVLLLVTENRTQLEDIDEAQNVLEQCRAQNVSLVFTQLRESVR